MACGSLATPTLAHLRLRESHLRLPRGGFGVRGGLTIAFLPLEALNAAFGLTRPARVLGFGVRGGLMIAFLPLEHVNARPPRVLGFRGSGWAHDSIPAS